MFTLSQHLLYREEQLFGPASISPLHLRPGGIWIARMYVCMYVCMYMNIYIYIYIHMPLSLSLSIYIYIYIYIYVLVINGSPLRPQVH